MAYEESVREASVKTKTCFGKATELYHVAGNVTLVGRKASFKGCKSFTGIQSLSRAIQLCDEANRVHMAVLSASIGVRVQVSGGGYLESRLNTLYRSVPVASEPALLY